MNIEKFKNCVKALIDLDYRLAKAPQTPKSLENDFLVEIGTYFNVLRMLDDESYLDAMSEIAMKKGAIDNVRNSDC